jgi:hypothetical protein
MTICIRVRPRDELATVGNDEAQRGRCRVGDPMPDMNGPQIVEQVLKFVAEKKLD